MKNTILILKLKTGWIIWLIVFSNIVNANLIINGDFENGDQSFTTDYSLGIGIGETRYNIATDPFLFHGAATSFGDHTTGNGKMMAVNGATLANQLVWGQNVHLKKNTYYELSVWVASWYPLAPARLEVSVENIASATFNALGKTGVWTQTSLLFYSGANSGNQFLSITDTVRAAVGNDFALDDITLKQITPVPLPASIMFFCSSLIGIALMNLRRLLI